MDLSELLDKLLKTGEEKAKANHAQVLHRPESSKRNDRMLVYHPAGDTFTFHDVPPAARAYTAESLVGLVELVTDLHERKVVDEANPIRVFVGQHDVHAVLGEATRREHVLLGLSFTAGWNALRANELASLSQLEMVERLRLDFRNEVAPATFVPSIRKLKFNSSGESHGNVSVGNGSMGRSVMMQAMADGAAIAEEVDLTVRIYDNVDPGIAPAARVRCGVRVQLEQTKLGLRPLAGELDGAIGTAQAQICAWLRGQLPQDVKVFNGLVP